MVLTGDWIISRHADLVWLIGGALAGYAMFYLHAVLHADMLAVWFVWLIILDSPHFFGTYARTYFDREEWHRRRGLLLGSLGLFLVGPLLLFISFALFQSGAANYRWPFLALVAIVHVWAYWHVVRQHYGILALYRRKNRDLDPLDRCIDNLFLYVSLLAPFLAFVVRHPDSRQALGLPVAYGTWEGRWTGMTVAAVVIVLFLFILRQVHRRQQQQPLNLPKILFLGAVIPLHLLICYSSAVLTAPLLGFALFVTIFHDIQYHALIWFYQKNRYRGSDAVRYGFASWLGKRFLHYVAAAILMGTILGFLGCLLDVIPGCSPMLLTGAIPLFGEFTIREFLFTVFLGFMMHHYLLDQFIWRPSRDSHLQRDLHL